MRFLKIVFCLLLLLGYKVSIEARDAINDSISVLAKHLEKFPNDKEALRKISFFYLNKADYDNAIKYGKRLFDIGYTEGDYDRAAIYSHICLGQAYMMTGNVKEAYSHLGQAQLIGETNKNDSALCSIYNGLGLYCSNVKKDYYRSLAYFFKGIEAAKRSRYDRLYSILLTNIAGIYYLEADTTGLKYALECYQLGQKRQDTYLIYSGATNTAYMYYLKGDYQQAIRYLKEAETVMLGGDYHDQSNVYNLYGHIMRHLGRLDEATRYYRKSLAKKGQSNVSSAINAYQGYAEVLMERRQYAAAINMLLTGLTLSYHQGSTVYRSDLLRSLAQCYEASDKPTEALRYYKLFQRETDSLFNAEKERAVEEIRAKYDIERQENLIKQNQLELQEKENKMFLLVACLVCFAIVAALLYYLYYRKNKLYLAIVRQNQEAFRREEQLRHQLAERQGEAGQDSTLSIPNEKEPIKPSPLPSEKYAASSLTEEKKQDLYKQLENLLIEQRVYTDNMLTKEKVAEMLGTNRTYLSQIINEQTNQSFTQFITGFRTREAVRQLSAPDNQIPLKALSAELGFNSMTTFYRQFQLATGMTPNQYRNKVQELHAQSIHIITQERDNM